MRAMKKRRAPRNNDAKSEAAITAAGWIVLRRRGQGYVTTAKVEEPAPRFVAVKRVSEPEDDTVTHRYESSYTLEGLAKQVVRREREETR